MGVFKNDVGRPSNEVVKTRMLLKILGCIVIICIFFAIGYFAGNISDNTNSDVDNNTSSVVSKKQIQKEEAEKIIVNFFGESYMNYIYMANDDVYNNEQFKTSIAISKTSESLNDASCNELLKGQIDGYREENQTSPYIMFNDVMGGVCYDSNRGFYKYDDVNKNYHKLFGNSNDAVKESFNIIFTHPYAYSKNENGYKSLSCECGDALFYISGITSAYEENTNLVVEVVSASFESYAEDKNLLTLLDGTTITLTDDEANDENTYNKYQDNMNKYRFTFEKSNGDYIFIKSEKIK